MRKNTVGKKLTYPDGPRAGEKVVVKISKMPTSGIKVVDKLADKMLSAKLRIGAAMKKKKMRW